MKIEDCKNHDEVVTQCKLDDLAYDLISNFVDMHDDLVDLRRGTLSIEEVAKRTGWTVDMVKEFEHENYSPTVQDVRIYAMAIGTRVKITVIPDEIL